MFRVGYKSVGVAFGVVFRAGLDRFLGWGVGWRVLTGHVFAGVFGGGLRVGGLWGGFWVGGLGPGGSWRVVLSALRGREPILERRGFGGGFGGGFWERAEKDGQVKVQGRCPLPIAAEFRLGS